MTEKAARSKAFLLRAKRATYAAKAPEVEPSRPASHDLRFEADGGWLYIDTYLGGPQFAGEEAVWKDGTPLWAMNYCGRVKGPGFSGDFLKQALLRVPEDMPYRGPAEYREGSLLYRRESEGDMDWFHGHEEIYENDACVYECVFHGGAVM